MKPLYLLAWACLLLLTSTSYRPAPAGGKTAYRLHYRGTLFFIEGKYQRAVDLFEEAYALEPDNFNFALSLGLSLGRVGRTVEGLNVLKFAQLSEYDPSYPQKVVLKLFFEGMVHAYAGHFHQAIPLYRQCLPLQEKLREPTLLSLIHNAMGYAILCNQGKGNHGPDLPPHYHVHKRDILRAQQHFEQALALDGNNEAARYNYQLLADSVGLEAKVFTREEAAIKALKAGNTYNNLPDNVNRALEFANFQEVVFLLDISGSMVQEKVVCKNATRFAVMKETMQLILNGMDEKTSIGIGTIGGDCGTTPKLWYRSTEVNRKQLRQYLQFLNPDGTTPLLTILKASPELFADTSARSRSIFLVSDGANVCGANGLDICEWARSLPRQNITINILTFLETNFSNTEAFAEYTCLADLTRGRILYIDNYRCRLERYEFDMVETCEFRIPSIQKVECWGPAVKDLWAILEE